ncbi:MAG: hypothetical protein M1830_002073, partial [Pleopsidium flavum]
PSWLASKILSPQAEMGFLSSAMAHAPRTTSSQPDATLRRHLVSPIADCVDLVGIPRICALKAAENDAVVAYPAQKPE